MSVFTYRSANREGTVKMIERVLNILGGNKNTLVTTYRGFILQVDVDTKSPLVVVRLGKQLPCENDRQGKILNDFNKNSFLGTHIIYNLEDKPCYTYKEPCWVDENITESEFKNFLERCNNKAIECYNELTGGSKDELV